MSLLLALAQDESGSGLLEELPDYTGLLLETVIVLGVMLGLLIIAARLLKRWQDPRLGPDTGPIEVVASRTLEPRRRLYLVRVGEEYCLIGSSEHGLHALSSMTSEPPSLSTPLPPADELPS